MHNDRIHFLEEALSLSFKKILEGQSLKNSPRTVPEEGEENNYDLKSGLEIINMKNWREIEKMSPFGLGNSKPIFLFSNVRIEKIKKFGKNGSGEHLEIAFSDVSGKTKGVSFFSNHDSFNEPLLEDKKVDLLATFDLSRFRGREELRLRIIDIIR